MTITGAEYEMTVGGKSAAVRNVYRVSGAFPTDEQKAAIDKCEAAVHGRLAMNTAEAYNRAEVLGIALDGFIRGADGEWREIETEDARMSMMQTGANYGARI